MVYHGYDMTSKPNYLVDICKKLVITIIFLGCNGVSNTTKISWYIANYDIQNGVFYMLVKHLPEKNTIIFFNTIILSQNFKNNLFPNTPKL
jgi:hypothetical protein